VVPVVNTAVENSNITLKTLCNENGSILLPQIRTEICVYCWRDITRARARVCVHGRNLEEQWREGGGGGKWSSNIFSTEKYFFFFFFLVTELKMANKK